MVGCAGCHKDVASTDNAFYNFDNRRMHCAIDIDSSSENDLASIETGLDRARDRGEVVELFAHNPGNSIQWSTVEAVVSGAHDRGLTFFTYSDIANGNATPGPGILLSFDDWYPNDWVVGRDMFQQYGARLTFFCAKYAQYTDEERANVQLLASDGHDIEPHTVNHLRAPGYVEDNGLDAYLANEVDPSIELLAADGYPITTFAYPFGARTDEIDAALYKRVRLLRSVSFTWDGITDPCPY